MKTYTAQKEYYIIHKDGKYVAGSKVKIGRQIITDDSVEWFDNEVAYKARLDAFKTQKPTK